MVYADPGYLVLSR